MDSNRFRAKRLYSDEWVIGYYLKSGTDYHGGIKHCIAVNGTCNDYLGLKFIEIRPETLEFIGTIHTEGKNE